MDAIKAKCRALWRIAHEESDKNPTTAQELDTRAIVLAKSIGLNYGDFDHEECTAPPTADDRKMAG